MQPDCLKMSSMKRLNFFPYYEGYLRSKEKTTTIRLDNHRGFLPGEEVIISLGWEGSTPLDIHKGMIKEVYSRRIKDITEQDLKGESPDCQSKETVKLVLGCIYKKKLADDDTIWIIKFEHV